MKIENDIEINKDTIVHKIKHSFIHIKNNKKEIIQGSTEYIIIDQSGKNEPKHIIKHRPH